MELDVAVIGASSAGLFVAEQIARAGRRVAVFERQPALAHARRTLIITPQLLRVLGDIPPHVVLHHTPVIEVHTPGATTRVELQEPDLIVERHALSEHLAQRAQQAGAQLLFDHRFETMHPAGSAAELRFAQRNGPGVAVRAKAVVGADGLFSAVGAAAGLSRPPVVQIIQAELELPADWDPRVTRVWFDIDDTQYFYWLIPENERHGVLGVITDDGAGTRELLDRFLARQGLQALRYQASHVAMYRPGLRTWGTLGTTPVFLVGDAAGHVKVTTVGGTVSGFYGAEAAARALLGTQSPRRAFRQIKRELDLHWLIREVLERLDNEGYNRLMANITPEIQGFLARRNRDAMAGAAWRLPLLRPQLLLLGLLAFARRVRPQPRPHSHTQPASD